jgi:hypothetical protein
MKPEHQERRKNLMMITDFFPPIRVTRVVRRDVAHYKLT